MGKTPKEKAIELINKFNPHVYCYVGSSFLTGDVSPRVMFRNAKNCALIALDEILNIGAAWFDPGANPEDKSSTIEYWESVQSEVKTLSEAQYRLYLPSFPDSKPSQPF